MRIIAGKYKGRRLKTLEGMHVRPTADRWRETVFNILAPRIVGARFVDVCAGSGAMGIEALSRGAREVVFIENNRRAAQLISDNLQHCAITAGARVINRDALTALKYLAQRGLQYDIFYLDPPYDAELYSLLLWLLGKQSLLATGGLVIVEHRRQTPLAADYETLHACRELTQGETQLTFYSLSKEM
jgi:16S rRNA (guanine(966)-N(2))-methyltransferase RsmD